MWHLKIFFSRTKRTLNIILRNSYMSIYLVCHMYAFHVPWSIPTPAARCPWNFEQVFLQRVQTRARTPSLTLLNQIISLGPRAGRSIAGSTSNLAGGEDEECAARWLRCPGPDLSGGKLAEPPDEVDDPTSTRSTPTAATSGYALLICC
jgi:hypothetical protein